LAGDVVFISVLRELCRLFKQARRGAQQHSILSLGHAAQVGSRF
jgi:hypothetical protein